MAIFDFRAVALDFGLAANMGSRSRLRFRGGMRSVGNVKSLLPILGMVLVACLFQVRSLAEASSEGRVNHVVMVWLKESAGQEARNFVVEETLRLRRLPGLLELRVGRAVPSDRPIVEDSFDIGFVFVFENERAMQAYVSHPEHVKLVKETLGLYVERIAVVDISETIVDLP